MVEVVIAVTMVRNEKRKNILFGNTFCLSLAIACSPFVIPQLALRSRLEGLALRLERRLPSSLGPMNPGFD